MQHLLALIRQLRSPEGCAWDRAQTHLSLRPYLLEEAAEAVEAINGGQPEELCAELGDVLLQVAFHSVIAQEQGTFGYEDVEAAIAAKLVRRHPHVFAPIEQRPQVENTEQLWALWQHIKAQEQAGQKQPDKTKLPPHLGALQREQKAQKLWQHAQADNPDLGSALQTLMNATQTQQAEAQHVGTEQAGTEQAGTAQEREQALGQFLAAVVAWSSEQGLDAEMALRAHTARQLAAEAHGTN